MYAWTGRDPRSFSGLACNTSISHLVARSSSDRMPLALVHSTASASVRPRLSHVSLTVVLVLDDLSQPAAASSTPLTTLSSSSSSSAARIWSASLKSLSTAASDNVYSSCPGARSLPIRTPSSRALLPRVTELPSCPHPHSACLAMPATK